MIRAAGDVLTRSCDVVRFELTSLMPVRARGCVRSVAVDRPARRCIRSFRGTSDRWNGPRADRTRRIRHMAGAAFRPDVDDDERDHGVGTPSALRRRATERVPFKSFRHEHVFTPVENGTQMVDQVEFDGPVRPSRAASPNAAVLDRYLRHLIAVRNTFLDRCGNRRRALPRAFRPDDDVTADRRKRSRSRSSPRWTRGHGGLPSCRRAASSGPTSTGSRRSTDHGGWPRHGRTCAVSNARDRTAVESCRAGARVVG